MKNFDAFSASSQLNKTDELDLTVPSNLLGDNGDASVWFNWDVIEDSGLFLLGGTAKLTQLGSGSEIVDIRNS